jgi:hypothetical protein
MIAASAVALAACSDSGITAGEGGAPGPVDASPADATAAETGPDASSVDASNADAGNGAAIQRKATLVMAAPDLPPQYVCLLGFEPTDGSVLGAPVVSRGPWGVPDPSDPNVGPVFGMGETGLPVKLVSGFPYSAVANFPIRVRDAPLFDKLYAVLFMVAQVAEDVFAGDSVDSTTCRTAWAAVADAGASVPSFTIEPGTVQLGQSYLVGVSGCANSSTDPQCAGGNNLTQTQLRLDQTTPSSFTGTGGTTLGIQVADLGVYAGYQGVDFYVQPMGPGDAGVPDDGGSPADAGSPGVPSGPPIPIGAHGQGLNWTQITAPSTGVSLSSATLDLTLLLVVEHGTVPWCGGQTPCSTTTAIPIQPFLTKYASTGAAWSGNQTFVLFGRPALAPGETPSEFLRLGVFPSAY